MADSNMEDTEALTAQIWSAFQDMSPLLDPSLKLSQNGPPKRQRRGAHNPNADQAQPSLADKVPLAQTLTLLTKLTLQLDRQMQTMKREDTFIFFFTNKGKEGSLQTLIQATEAWAAKHQENQQAETPKPVMPLRQHLMQVLFNSLLTRVEQLGNAADGSEVVNAAQHSKVLLKDRTCPYLEWNASLKELTVSRRKPLSLKRIHQICTDLLEALANPNLVVKFHALPAGSKQEISPWRLQVSMRQDDPWQMLQELCSSGIWLLMGTSLKCHSLDQSPLAYQLQQSLNPGKGKMKGRGKGKNKMAPATKQE